MRTFTVVVERDPDTGLFVGSVPGFPGAHSQGATLDELQVHMVEVLELLLDGEVELDVLDGEVLLLEALDGEVLLLLLSDW